MMQCVGGDGREKFGGVDTHPDVDGAAPGGHDAFDRRYVPEADGDPHRR